MAARIMRQVSGCAATPAPAGSECGQPLADAVAALPVLDAAGERVQFGALFRERRAVVVFVRHFLCYICQEYVEDLAKIPKSFLQTCATLPKPLRAKASRTRPEETVPHSSQLSGPSLVGWSIWSPLMHRLQLRGQLLPQLCEHPLTSNRHCHC
ncbi:peroxiredoxin-like 2C isoform 1-T1 [Thomomys bottae]